MIALRRLLPFSVALLLTACASQQAEEVVVAIEPEPVMAEPSADLGRVSEACEPGATDDGIGGTGCSVD